ncbi:MAG: transcriptional repressor [Nitrospiraceae bacterium]|nr:transcriptional repressor [Nitrospiraceae bacterium]
MPVRSEKHRDRRFKMTPQRLAILDYLKGNVQHPAADDVFRAVRRKYPTMSFATVYNTLEALKKRGMVKELTGDPDKKRFDPNTSPHHHLICTNCRKIVDIPVQFDLDFAEQYREGFVITGSHIEFSGICLECRNRSRA